MCIEFNKGTNIGAKKECNQDRAFFCEIPDSMYTILLTSKLAYISRNVLLKASLSSPHNEELVCFSGEYNLTKFDLSNLAIYSKVRARTIPRFDNNDWSLCQIKMWFFKATLRLINVKIS